MRSASINLESADARGDRTTARSFSRASSAGAGLSMRSRQKRRVCARTADVRPGAAWTLARWSLFVGDRHG